MEDSSSEFSQKLTSFLKENILIVLLGLIGIVLLLYGLIQTQKPKQEIKFEAAENPVTTKKEADVINKIMIDVSGAVIKPGVYQLNAESRIQDAISSAGGLSEEADRAYLAKNVNLAQKLTDGGKLYIPKAGEQAVLGSTSSNSNVININTASATDLDSLSGVGPATSAKIIENRPYANVDELLSKKIVSNKVFNSIKDKISTY